MTPGSAVRDFEKAFAEYVGAKYCIALCNGTATLHTALVALGVRPGDKVATTPLTMSATTLAILHAGAVPVYCDVDEVTWLMAWPPVSGTSSHYVGLMGLHAYLPVSLYGLHSPDLHWTEGTVDDAAQTLRPHNEGAAFTSYSFQASKILPLGEGGMLATNDEELAVLAREFSSLGYRMRADQPRIDKNVIKHPDFERHHSIGWNYRMNDMTAASGLWALDPVCMREESDSAVSWRRTERLASAHFYSSAIQGCSWIRPQYVPEGWTHDYWCYAVALESKELSEPFTQAIVKHGGEMPYGAWRLSFDEPALKHLDPGPGACPVARDLQPRLLQFQTNNLISAQRNAGAVEKAIREIGGAA